MSKEDRARSQVPQGTLDLIVLRTLATLGPQHAYGLALRLQQISDDLLNLNQGTLYPALLRLEQQGFIEGDWRTTQNNREAKYYALTRAGQKELAKETKRWTRLAGLMEKLLGGPA
jgi:PadR family transcriptional regulator, regulatory protein PadR